MIRRLVITTLVLVWIVGIAIVAVAQAPASAPSVRTVDSIAELRALNPQPFSVRGNKATVRTLGYYEPGDGGDLEFYRSDPVGPDNGGTVIDSDWPGVQWHAVKWDGDARKFGIKGDGTTTKTDNTASLQAAIDYAESIKQPVYIPGGVYVVDSLTLRDGIIRGAGHAYQVTGEKKTTLLHKVPASGNMLNVDMTVGQAEITDIELQGNKEQNLVNPKAITATSPDRLSFTVATASLPEIPASPGAFPYRGFAFFYDPNNHYLGSALIYTMDHGTGVSTIFPGWDNYALPLGKQVLDSTIKVCFSPNLTQGSAIVNRVDPSSAGWAGINWTDPGGAEGLTIRDVTIGRFHTGLRMTTPLALNLDNVWIRASAFANIARAVPGNGADALGRRVYLQGFYMADDDLFDTWPTLENTYYQSTLFGLYGPGPRDVWHDMSTSRHIVAICDPVSYDVYFGNLLVDVPVKHAWYAPNGAASNVDGSAGVTIQSMQIATANYTKPTNITYIENFNSAFVMPAGTRGKNMHIGTLSVSPYPGADPANNFDYIVRMPTAANNPSNSFTVDRVLGTGGANAFYWTSGVMPKILHTENLSDQSDIPTTISHTKDGIILKAGGAETWQFAAAQSTHLKPFIQKGGEFGATMVELNREAGSPGRMGFGVSGDFLITRNVEDNVIASVVGATASSVAWYAGNISAQASPRTANIVSEAASGENVAGANLTFRSGKGTGSATPSSITFVVPSAGSSGSSAQTEATRLFLQEPTTPANGDTIAVVSWYDGSVPEWKVRRVVIGDADSGGAGFRALRITN